MPGSAIALAAAAALLLLLVALKLRGPRGGRDLLGPPKRKRKRIGFAEARRLADLIDHGNSAEAVRQMRESGLDEADARRVAGLIERLAATDPEEGGKS